MSYKMKRLLGVMLVLLVVPMCAAGECGDDETATPTPAPAVELVPLLEAAGEAIEHAQECPNSTICWNATTVCPNGAGCDATWQAIADTCEACG